MIYVLSLFMFNVTLIKECELQCIYIRHFRECVAKLFFVYNSRAEKYQKRL